MIPPPRPVIVDSAFPSVSPAVKGSLPPRGTSAEVNAITPVHSLSERTRSRHRTDLDDVTSTEGDALVTD
ncbi:hypothetical protein ACFOY2_05810 [Nonomuraea purpurea]|uniref:FXSXX-COOH protein n=1 Tax=Nonomuraea purpurea TaxID=1849276 RepID=A0ABV8G244_9ACTN